LFRKKEGTSVRFGFAVSQRYKEIKSSNAVRRLINYDVNKF
jgi:hypothetical protein